MGESSTNNSPPPKCVYKTGTINSCDSLIVAGTINGKPCDLTIDTGSNISIIRTSFLASEERASIQSVNSCLKTVTGEKAPIHGKGSLHVSIGKLTMTHPMWVADISDSCILGLDFLEHHNCSVNVKQGTLTIGSFQFPLKKSNSHATPLCCRVTLAKKVHIPPLSEAVVPVHVEGTGDHFWGLLEPVYSPQTSSYMEGVLVARTLVNVQKDVIPLRVMNLTRAVKTIAGGSVVGHCDAVVDVSVPVEREEIGACECIKVRAATSVDFPPHLKQLYERSSEGLSSSQQAALRQLLCEHSQLFSTGPQHLGSTGLVTHHIHTGDATPIRQQFRRLPLAKKDEVEKAVREMESQGIIEPSCSAWCSPIVLVTKKDGSTRFCVDYRKLNEVTRKDSYPLPRIEDAIDSLGGSQWFSSLDLKSGYWQVKLSEEAKSKTAFSTGAGLWQFKVMPFGLCNAPATFERLMEQVLSGLPSTVALLYLDDILVPGKTFEKQVENLQSVFIRLRMANLKLNAEKCCLLRKEVKYLGHIVGCKGISPDPEKVQAVLDWPVPENTQQVRSFIGLASYYRRFIANFTELASPLLQLTQKNVTFVWSVEANCSFVELKRALTSAPVLAYPDPSHEFVLDTDASSVGIGSILSQRDRPVAFYSKALSAAQKNYCVTRKELLAVVDSIKHFHPYLYGQKFTIRTDHAALKWLLHFRYPEGQVARWLEILQGYNFSIEHQSGALHTNADAMSRRPCNNCKHCDRLETMDRMSTVEGSTDVTASQRSGDQDSLNEVLQPKGQLSCRAVAFDADSLVNVVSTPEELKEYQLKDEDLKPIISWLEESENRPPWDAVSAYSGVTKAYWAQWKSLCLEQGLLVRLWETPSGDSVVKQIVVPKALQKRVLECLHGTIPTGHFGVAKTLGRVKEQFYWVKSRQDVQEWCEKCDICARKRGPPRKPKAAMKKYVVGLPMERVALDILGSLPTTPAGNKYILVVSDYFSKWVEAFAIPDQEASTVANLLVREVICRFGVPLFIHSDQGRNFESLLFAEVCSLLGMEKTRTTSYHPQSDGMVERFNRTLENQLSRFVNEHHTDWDEHIPYILMAYRSAVHESTKCTPAKVLFGSELRLPIDLYLGRPDTEQEQSVSEYVSCLQEKLESIHKFTRGQLQLVSDKMKDRYDLLQTVEPLERGDPVWLYQPQRKRGLSPKLQSNWEGPYLIIKKINDLVYRVQQGPRTKAKVVHRNRLWRYSGSNPPTSWLQNKDGRV